MHPARLVAVILLAVAGLVMAAAVALALATEPNVDYGLSWSLFGVFGVLLVVALIAMVVWLRDR